MTRNQRLALVAAVLAVAVVAFVIARAGGDDDGNGAGPPAVETTPQRSGGQTTPATTEQAPAVERIEIRGTEVQGGVRTIRVTKGDRVRIVIASDAPDQLHLHGYDIEQESRPGAPARFDFEANLEGIFELESHTAEHAGLEPAVAKLVVGPS